MERLKTSSALEAARQRARHYLRGHTHRDERMAYSPEELLK